MANFIPNERHNAIVESISYWLGYQFKIGRDKLIHEASLRYPIADTITAKGVSINRIVLEKLHPLFKSKKIDLVIFNEKVQEPESEKNDINLSEVYEFKLAKLKTSEEYSDEHQSIFDDVVRLAYYNLWERKNCFFLMCGKYDEFKAYFVGQQAKILNSNGTNLMSPKTTGGNPSKDFQWQPEGLYKDWFGFNVGDEKEKKFAVADHVTWGLQTFKNNYEVRKEYAHSLSDSINIKTKCVAITSSRLEGSRTHAAGIWEIQGIS